MASTTKAQLLDSTQRYEDMTGAVTIPNAVAASLAIRREGL